MSLTRKQKCSALYDLSEKLCVMEHAKVRLWIVHSCKCLVTLVTLLAAVLILFLVLGVLLAVWTLVL